MVQGPGYQIRGLCCWWWSHAQMVIRAARPPPRAPQVGERSERQRWGTEVGPAGGSGGRIPEPVPLSC